MFALCRKQLIEPEHVVNILRTSRARDEFHNSEVEECNLISSPTAVFFESCFQRVRTLRSIDSFLSFVKSGKFDEELARMSEIADDIVPNSMLLFNESFAATNEREGSEIGAQIVRALLENGIKVFYVTHLYEFARGFFNDRDKGVCLRAEREADGRRTFKLAEGEPLQTSYGQDLYNEVFGVEDQTVVAGQTMSS